MGYEVVDVDYDIYEYKRVGKRKKLKVNTGRKQFVDLFNLKKVLMVKYQMMIEELFHKFLYISSSKKGYKKEN